MDKLLNELSGDELENEHKRIALELIEFLKKLVGSENERHMMPILVIAAGYGLGDHQRRRQTGEFPDPPDMTDGDRRVNELLRAAKRKKAN